MREADFTPEGARARHAGFFAGTRRRSATAGALAWLDDDHLLVGHLVTSTLLVYRVENADGAPTFHRVGGVSEVPGLDLPTDLAVVPGRRVAVTSSGTGTLDLLDASGFVDGEGLALLGRAHHAGDRNVHGVDVSPDGRWLVYSTIDLPGGLRVVAVDALLAAGPQDAVEPLAIHDEPLSAKPKGVAFSADGRHLVLTYGPNVGAEVGDRIVGWIEVRSWDTDLGRTGEVVARLEVPGMSCPEALAPFPDGETFVVTDHVEDGAWFVRLDPHTGELQPVDGVGIGWSRGGLRAPHGCVVTPGGKAVVVASYGDATVRVFALDGPSGPGPDFGAGLSTAVDSTPVAATG